MCIVILIWSVRFPFRVISVPSAWVPVYPQLDCPAEWSSSHRFSNNRLFCQDYAFPPRWLGSDSAPTPRLSVSILFCLRHNRRSLVSATGVPTTSVGTCRAPLVLCCLEAVYSFVVLGIELGAPHMPNKSSSSELCPGALFTSHFETGSQSLAQAGLEFTLWHSEALNLQSSASAPGVPELHIYANRPG